MSILPSKRYYVYVLKSPDGRPFYVGKGSGGRVMDHAAEASKGCQCRKCLQIRQIWTVEKADVQYDLVLQTDQEEAAYLYDRRLIEEYGLSSLTNGQPGKRNFITKKKNPAAPAPRRRVFLADFITEESRQGRQ